MNFLREFKTENDYLSVKDNFEYPTVSLVNETNMIYFMNNSLYEFVDLGLPSGTKWASCNVGAEKPEDFGLYFAWGETEGYIAYRGEGSNSGTTYITDANGNDTDKGFYWGDYKFTTAATGATDSTFRGGLTKYNNKSASGVVDNKLVLEVVDDAAYVSDKTCRMPTKADFEELTANTTSKWETLNGIKGRRFTSKTNGNSIFVPAAGGCNGGSVSGVGSFGFLWSSSLYESSSRLAWNLYFFSDDVYVYDYVNRCYGFSVRAVL